jgi:hypothetical protein
MELEPKRRSGFVVMKEPATGGFRLIAGPSEDLSNLLRPSGIG